MTAATEKQVRMAAQLYEMRETARRLLGDAFKPRMAELGSLLTDIGKQHGKEPLAVAIALSKKGTVSAMDSLIVMAAAVELAEPSK